jgi:hypothetical protein
MSDLEDEGQPKRSFKVEDRRRFSETGETRSDADVERAPAPTADTVAQPPPRDESGRHGEGAAMPINFSTFVISLSTQALAHLGEIADPMGGGLAVDLVAAKQLIDMLGVLEEKTRGNLDEAEAGLLEHCLYDLRLKYVELARR